MHLPLYSATDYLRVGGEEHLVGNEITSFSDFRDDVIRLINSPSFRRLQGKMQLFPGHENDFFRNRLTHSFEVAQIAKSIGMKLNSENEYLAQFPLNLDLLEFAGLAHDLGHPPFGHHGERVLNQIMLEKEQGGFEGNAQTLRILTRLEKKSLKTKTPKGSRGIGIDSLDMDYRLGLNLTSRTLASVFKYDKEISKTCLKNHNLIKGYYTSEKCFIETMKKNIHSSATQSHCKTVECQILDIADDIANAVYDLEDAFKAGFINPLDLIAAPYSVRKSAAREVAKEIKTSFSAENIMEEIVNIFNDFLMLDDFYQIDNKKNSLAAVAAIYKKAGQSAGNGFFRAEVTSKLLNGFLSGIKFEYCNNPVFSKISMNPTMLKQLKTLKYIIYEIITISPRLAICEYRGEEIIKTIFESLAGKRGGMLMPCDMQEIYNRTSSDGKFRVLCDFIASMTDSYAIDIYARIKSENARTIFKSL